MSNDTLKLFISVPANGRSDTEVEAEKVDIFQRAQSDSESPMELIDSYIREDAPVDGDRAGAWYLGRSIEKLATADAAYFAEGWQDARGCIIERSVCEKYGIPILPEREKVLYVCDPEKATECLKTGCAFVHNNAECCSTTRREWALVDEFGDPVSMKTAKKNKKPEYHRAYYLPSDLIDAIKDLVITAILAMVLINMVSMNIFMFKALSVPLPEIADGIVRSIVESANLPWP